MILPANNPQLLVHHNAVGTVENLRELHPAGRAATAAPDTASRLGRHVHHKFVVEVE
jgi:hypothetical protein